MSDRLKVVLFTEVNSKLGSPFLRVLSAHPLIDLVAVVTSPNEVVCNYFVNDEKQVDVETESQALGIDVLRPRRVGDPEVAGALKRMEPDYFIVANFQQLLRSELLSIPRIAAINFHPSPLPRYAGLAPFFWIVRNGDRRSAISVIKMDEGLDTRVSIPDRSLYSGSSA
ncbi:MAG: Methionyl-tRNA formyltransferase related protein [uncultured Caballeronia sp.]|nr:MAG: Methionyl-tRNA formyltransferase related protein [uncultured Caballeronia sp.]